MGYLWKHYRCDFTSSTGQDNQSPVASFEWTRGQWVRRGRADAPIDLTDAKGRIFMQVDTASTEAGTNNTTSADINILAAAIPDSSTNTLGGRFDSSSLGYFAIVPAFGDNLRKSVNLTSTFADTVPIIKLRYDNNTTLAGACSVVISFRT